MMKRITLLIFIFTFLLTKLYSQADVIYSTTTTGLQASAFDDEITLGNSILLVGTSRVITEFQFHFLISAPGVSGMLEIEVYSDCPVNGNTCGGNVIHYGGANGQVNINTGLNIGDSFTIPLLTPIDVSSDIDDIIHVTLRYVRDVNSPGGQIGWQTNQSTVIGSRPTNSFSVCGSSVFPNTCDNVSGTSTYAMTIKAICFPAGTACDDGLANTINDVKDGNCNCFGTLINTESVDVLACPDQTTPINLADYLLCERPGGIWSSTQSPPGFTGGAVGTFIPNGNFPADYFFNYSEGGILLGTIKVTVSDPGVGIVLPDANVCVGDPTVISLADLLSGEQGGGAWTLNVASDTPQSGFNPAGGTFAIANNPVGSYLFDYTQAGTDIPGVAPLTCAAFADSDPDVINGANAQFVAFTISNCNPDARVSSCPQGTLEIEITGNPAFGLQIAFDELTGNSCDVSNLLPFVYGTGTYTFDLAEYPDVDPSQQGICVAVYPTDGNNNNFEFKATLILDYEEIPASGCSNSTSTVGININAGSASLLYVDENAAGGNNGSSWTDAFTHLQDALAATSCTDTIWVAAGTYYPDDGGSQVNNDRNASFNMQSGLVMLGGFDGTEPANFDVKLRDMMTNETILSGDIDQITGSAGNSYQVISNLNIDNTAVLDGFTITGGDGISIAGNGGGIYNDNSSPIIQNCFIHRNQAERGGAMYNINGSAPVMINCTFMLNYATATGGAIVLGPTSSSTINYSTFSGNYASMGAPAIANFDGNLSISYSILWGNGYGSGVLNADLANFGGAPDICTNCIIDTDGGGIHPGTGNSNQDPLFIDQPPLDLNYSGGDLRLNVGSPAIDYVVNVNGPMVDQDGQMRPIGTAHDIGAYEYCTPPINESCIDAITLNCGDVVTGNTECTSFQPVPDIFFGTIDVKGVWYEYVGQDTPVQLTTCSSNTDFDTQISIFIGTCGNLQNQILFNDNDPNCTTGVGASSRELYGDPGVTFYILVSSSTPFGSFQSAGLDIGGNFELSITCIDDCPDDYNLTGTQSTDALYQTTGFIISDQLIDQNAQVDYSAGFSDPIELNAGFEVELGVIFHAFHNACQN